MTNPDGQHPNQVEILKKECYIFDFAPNRALRQIADYSCSLNPEEESRLKPASVNSFISYLYLPMTQQHETGTTPLTCWTSPPQVRPLRCLPSGGKAPVGERGQSHLKEADEQPAGHGRVDEYRRIPQPQQRP